MRLEELDFQYPDELVATERAPLSRIALIENDRAPQEIDREKMLELFRPGDVWVVNQTRVLQRRVFTSTGLEILFLEPLDSELKKWTVLCPSSRWKPGTKQLVSNSSSSSSSGPGTASSVELELIERGKPQTVLSSRSLDDQFFFEHGELPIPPYIQKARGERHNRKSDQDQYQSIWAKDPGSLAAPTASFHFDHQFESRLRKRGVKILPITLHVGLGTFLPVQVENLKDHVMHAEFASLSKSTINDIVVAKKAGRRVVAVGTTVARTLESYAHGLLEARNPETSDDSDVDEVGAAGYTALMIAPGFEWKLVDVLVTNFHQPKSTLMALVASFSSLKKVHEVYRWAIENKFRLFSYGDCTIWTR